MTGQTTVKATGGESGAGIGGGKGRGGGVIDIGCDPMDADACPT
ncbi:MAG: hypothetical protein LBD77_08675, partial [Bifidobacteriaceae bacterium]|nr:hypothetical protein [Bifidobacteriaceae bacterium]